MNKTKWLKIYDQVNTVLVECLTNVEPAREEGNHALFGKKMDHYANEIYNVIEKLSPEDIVDFFESTIEYKGEKEAAALSQIVCFLYITRFVTTH